MAGIFGGHLFDGMGQTATTTPLPDAASDELISTLATTGGSTSTTSPSKTGGSAYMPPAPSKTGGGAAYMPTPTTMAYTPAPASDNTVLYVVGGVAVVGLLAVLMMSGGRRGGTVTANRGKRGRRSRHRRSR